ncbi:MAG: SMP-30/gluconolactonase/LRE family protein [Gemmatimonadaceae bacterium]
MSRQTTSVRAAILGASIVLLGGCDRAPETAETMPRWSYDSTMIFPANRGLAKPEDGVLLPGGRLLVTDQARGLRIIDPDGSTRPFGELASAGYVHNPPAREGGANGISLEPDGAHALVTNIELGHIYRVNVTSGAAEKVYQHRYGINAAVRDSQGSIWFTQSAHNSAETGLGAMWAAVDAGVADGALLRLPMTGGRLAQEAKIILDSLRFANGIAIDEKNGHLYVSEMMANRVLRYRVDLATGALSERTVVLQGHAIDNLELDDSGNLWMVAPITNEVIVLNTGTLASHSAFVTQTTIQAERSAEFARRGEKGEARLELLSPEQWAPLPGFITGLILSPGRGPIYLTGLGDALIRLER